MDVVVEKPKEVYEDIKNLIKLHYSQVSGKGLDITERGFAVSYPNIYRLFLRIATLGLNK